MTRKKLNYGPGIAGSKVELAKYLGVDEKAVRKWIKRDDWPFEENPPWKAKEVRIWRKTYLSEDPGAELKKIKGDRGPSPLTVARVEGTIERTLLTRQRRLVEKGKLISAEEAQAIRLRQIQAVKSAFLSLPRSIANSLVGKTVEQIEEVLMTRIKSIMQTFAGE